MSKKTSTKVYEFVGRKVRPVELASMMKKLLGIKRRTYSVNGLRWYLDPVSNFGLRLLDEENYEPEMTGQLLEILEPGDTFIDLGANEGWFSILASKKSGK